ncbi:MAG: Ppx/GppA family phosphatase [Phenylobacterium sp.]|uniref:Ppx/GppA phosphatase family protein n=1 Tax=Phenylobacterium sp. TaxID=1871053 RepID=UPI001B60A968|nr:Ppx/GppA phosphatase family protein [Phenylobacterium sp.]MBP7816974.1 Ppx/GppA family phosphatase [Phenylobacterium sp.]MBP9756284.1 Ppx/GppA family phosphatase [Phenylobacterium sp.]
MWPRTDSSPGRQAAVIDLGSNSVRLVIYRLEGRAIWTVFNEKALAGLGRDLPATGRLSPEGIETAMAAMRRFRAVLDGLNASEIMVVATAAARDAVDGGEFLARVHAETGLRVRILTGEEEARYAALGVIAGQPDAQGVVGDLGGSSLELIRLEHGRSGDGVTLALGPFSLGAPSPLEVDKTRKRIDAALAPMGERFATRQFQAVGGAWRNLALLHMVMADYPLRVAHQYEMTRADAQDVARFVAKQSRGSLERIQGLSKKRFDTLPYSALVLDALIERLGVERVVISAYGLREGLLLEAMSADERARDPLIEGCEALTAVRGLSHDLGMALETWLTRAFAKLPPVFGDRDRVLTAAACRLADLGARLHPDHRADLAFDQVLRAPIAGMTHAERAFLACVAFARHSSAPTTPEPDTIAKVLSVERRQRARALGAAVRLGCDLSGRNATLLPHASLVIDAGRLTLTAEPAWRDMLLGEQTAKRAATLAQALKLKLEMA